MEGIKGITLSLFILWITLTIVISPANAGDEKERQIVYIGQINDGQGYRGQFYPSNEETVYLLAGEDNVFIPRVTDVYWWPIAQEFKADWDSKNEPIEGVLEVDGQVIERTFFSLRYAGGYESSKTSLIVGEVANQEHLAYQQELVDYNLAAETYRDLQAEFERQLVIWGDLIEEYRAKGESTDDIPVPKQPEAPEPITYTITKPEQAYIINLPQGEHILKLKRLDGEVVPGSERKVIAFSHRREGIAYKVIAASKWTLPEVSTEPDDIIFVSNESALYVQPSAEREYDAFYYAKLLNPQEKSVQDRRGFWTWAPAEHFVGDTLIVEHLDESTQTIHYHPFVVKQTSGSALGYSIVPYDMSLGLSGPTFEAFELRPQTDLFTISIPGVPGSTREICIVNTKVATYLISFTFIPFICGLAWMFVRRLRSRISTNIT